MTAARAPERLDAVESRARGAVVIRRLVTESGTRGAPVTVWGWTDDPTISPKVVRYAATVLRRLGYRTRVHLVPHDQIDAPLETIQVIPAAWGNDTPHGMFATPSERRQTAAALPCASTATCGESA